MPRGFGRGYGRYRFSPLGGFYGLVDILFLVGMLYFLIKLFIAAAPYAIGLVLLLALRAFLRPSRRPWFGPF